jgi:hypothetical protein
VCATPGWRSGGEEVEGGAGVKKRVVLVNIVLKGIALKKTVIHAPTYLYAMCYTICMMGSFAKKT